MSTASTDLKVYSFLVEWHLIKTPASLKVIARNVDDAREIARRLWAAKGGRNCVINDIKEAPSNV